MTERKPFFYLHKLNFTFWKCFSNRIFFSKTQLWITFQAPKLLYKHLSGHENLFSLFSTTRMTKLSILLCLMSLALYKANEGKIFYITDVNNVALNVHMIKTFGLLKFLSLWCGAFLEPFFKNGENKLIRGYFSHTGCPKNRNRPTFVQNNEMYGNYQNIGSPEKFCLCDVVHLWSFF